MATKNLPIPADRAPLRRFCQRHGITRLALFGSALRDDFSDQSDLDFLVEFHPDHIPGFIGLAGMELELAQLLGRRVDLQTFASLSPRFAHQVATEAETVYVAPR